MLFCWLGARAERRGLRRAVHLWVPRATHKVIARARCSLHNRCLAERDPRNERATQGGPSRPTGELARRAPVCCHLSNRRPDSGQVVGRYASQGDAPRTSPGRYPHTYPQPTHTHLVRARAPIPRAYPYLYPPSRYVTVTPDRPSLTPTSATDAPTDLDTNDQPPIGLDQFTRDTRVRDLGGS